MVKIRTIACLALVTCFATEASGQDAAAGTAAGQPPLQPGPTAGTDPIQEEPTRGVALSEQQPLDATYRSRHALVIGVDDYTDSSFLDLSYAAADARAIAKILVERFKFPQENVQLILDKDATKVAIERALEDWACDPDRVDEQDLLVIFFAGHGITRTIGNRGNRGYLVPVDGRAPDGQPIWSSLVGMNFLEDVSEALPVKHALFLLDCCFGGLAVKRSAPPVAAGLSSRARQILTAGTGEQAVLDGGGSGNSVFTGAVLDGLRGDADLDADGVITFGELFNHVGRDVELKTEERQTPLQATFKDHEGGNVALFPPGLVPGAQTVIQRLAELERSDEEQLAELKRLSDFIRIGDLENEADVLWPRIPDLVPAYRRWLVDARDVLSRSTLHEESLRLVRREAYLNQVIAGILEEGEGTEPIWEKVETDLRWRFDTFQRLVAGIERVERLMVDIQKRRATAENLERDSIHVHRAAWDATIAAIATSERYGRLELTPQLGLVPLGADPASGLHEFVDISTGEIPVRGDDGALRYTVDCGLVFVLIPAGEFVMGAAKQKSRSKRRPSNHDPHARFAESPCRKIRLDAFFLSKYEMTQRQWMCCNRKNPSTYGPGEYEASSNRAGKTHSLLLPVETVNHAESMRTVARLGLLLPTEAQWEYAARGGTDTIWWTGNEVESLQGAENLRDVFFFQQQPVGEWDAVLDDGHAGLAEVGSFRANPFGLHDVHGNVGEWCRDWYSEYRRPAREGDGLRITDNRGVAVVRGGSFFETATGSRSALRTDVPAELTARALGLRPSRAIDRP